MKNNSQNNKTIAKALSKVNFIITQKEEDEAEDDIIIKYIIKIIFPKDSNKKTLIFPKIKCGYSELLLKFIDLIHIMFNIPKEERDALYNIDINNIKDNDIITIIKEINAYKDIKDVFTKKELRDLYCTMNNYMTKKKIYYFII